MTQRVKRRERRRRQTLQLVAIWEHIYQIARRIRDEGPLQPDAYIFKAAEPHKSQDEEKKT